MSFKRKQVIILPTNENVEEFVKTKNRICIDSQNSILCVVSYPNRFRMKHQHLYITSDEEIKAGDWYIAFGNTGNYLLQCLEVKNGFIVSTNEDTYPFDTYKCKKIIASTDKSLGIPEPSQGFIAKYISEYNKGNVITDVLVEYEDKGREEWVGDDYNGEPVWFEKLVPYIRQNTITIKKVKDSWSREEVENLLRRFAAEHGTQSNKLAQNNWINENL